MALKPIPQPQEPKPEFSMARGAATQTAPPPYDFEEVTLRYFPLRANFHTLSLFVDDYLNVVPKEFAYFRPAMPFVLLCIVNYGRMAPGAGNLGWTAQNEVLFAVPIEWYALKDGEYVFQDVAQVTPFIWVDNEGSQIGGREVFGWPKVQGWYSEGPGAWTRHPRNPLDLLGLNTRVFEELYEDREDIPRELLVIREEAMPSFSQMPPDPNNPLNPLVSIPKAISGWSELAMRGLDMMMALPTRGYEALDGLSSLGSVVGSMDLFTKRLHANTINFKQMRNAGSPRYACYQALTAAQMEITQIRGSGLLGDLAMLRGDLSGGYTVRLHRYESLPIIETLGLEVERQDDTGEHPIAELKPVMPFWQEMDMKYLTGQNVCWRNLGSDWRNEEFEMDVTEEIEPESSEREEMRPEEDPALIPWMYNTTGSSGLQVATGPFHFTEASIRVLPLLAEKQRLRDIVDAQLNKVGSNGLIFQPWGSYVYMMISTYGEMYSETNDMGEWADRQIDFAIPVRCFHVAEGQPKRLLFTGFFSPFIYSDSTIGATTGREVYGWNAQKASIANAEGSWLDADGPFPELDPLLRLSTDVYPALFLGQENAWRPLIEVVDGHPVKDPSDWTFIAESWGRTTKHDVERLARGAENDAEEYRRLQALSLEILANRAPLNQVSFKQFRDAGEPDKACYQALVKRRWRIKRLFDLREIEHPTHVRIHTYETQPIVRELGLQVKSSWTSETGYVQALQPIRPFYLKAYLEADDGENLAVRGDTSAWKREPASTEEFLAGKEPAVGVGLLDLVDSAPHDLKGPAVRWHDESGSTMSLNDADGAVRSKKVEPQSAVNHMLSAEWGKPEEPNQPSQPKKPDFVLRRDSVGSAADLLFGESEGETYWSPGVED